ncbi:hypothetical protein GCM10009799_33920 [Nocardiopsis rhodophaea]|uniref:Cas3 C-terminal domain-containing protein n=1 Tax=Nocardiopsis rhodophaea TaxID=280238 RepID=A0ABN2TB70_9ACTN
MIDEDDCVPAPYDPGITLVPLWAAAEGPLTTRGGTSVDLSADELPTVTVAELADSAVTLTYPIDLEAHQLDALLDRLTVPPAFDRSGWLVDHHPLVLHDGRRDFDEFSIVHHPQRGLEIHG